MGDLKAKAVKYLRPTTPRVGKKKPAVKAGTAKKKAPKVKKTKKTVLKRDAGTGRFVKEM